MSPDRGPLVILQVNEKKINIVLDKSAYEYINFNFNIYIYKVTHIETMSS